MPILLHVVVLSLAAVLKGSPWFNTVGSCEGVSFEMPYSNLEFFYLCMPTSEANRNREAFPIHLFSRTLACEEQVFLVEQRGNRGTCISQRAQYVGAARKVESGGQT